LNLVKKIVVILSSLTVLIACAQTGEPLATDDPYLWLEDVEGEAALTWVEEQNALSTAHLESLATFEPLYERNLEIYDSEERVAWPGLRGEFVYNFWKDGNNTRGLWRRISLDAYVAGESDWDVILDLDALASEEDEDWVWKGSNCLRPAYEKCLLRLSRGGADAVVVREFDIGTRKFVKDGFLVAENKTNLSWIDANTVFVGSDFGDDSVTDSGYPRTARLWHRGEPLEKSREIFAGERKDVAVSVYRGWDGDVAYDVVHRTPTFFTAIRYLYAADGAHRKIEIPDDATFHGLMKGQMLVELKRPWKPADIEYVQGTLMSIDFEAFLDGARDFKTIYVPTSRSAIPRGGIITTRDFLIINQLEDVTSKLTRFEFSDGQWCGTDIETERLGSVSLVTAAEDSNLFFFSYEGFLRPDTLYVANDGGESIERLFSTPEFFVTDGMVVQQHFAVSKDGTKIPYFLVLPKGHEVDGDTATLMYGYGGFQISRTPRYSATVGHAWLQRGGAYVVANIRGGGEYGARWHHAALKENRQRAYDDMAAVAEDLIERGITRPERLGVQGGSNGGLLTGVMLTQRPDLWGAVIVQVPLLDMKRFSHLLAGASWMDEYGDPDTDDWEYIKKYSPYHNIAEDIDYPKAFFTTSTRDDRVHPAHARKMVARMRAMGHDLYYYENTVGGHAGASDNKQAARVQAMIYSYLWDQLGDD
jgi:prolyl oligopeptidase